MQIQPHRSPTLLRSTFVPPARTRMTLLEYRTRCLDRAPMRLALVELVGAAHAYAERARRRALSDEEDRREVAMDARRFPRPRVATEGAADLSIAHQPSTSLRPAAWRGHPLVIVHPTTTVAPPSLQAPHHLSASMYQPRGDPPTSPSSLELTRLSNVISPYAS